MVPSRLPVPADSAPIQLDAAALARVGDPIAAGLLPGWRVTWRVLSPRQIDALDAKLPGPNLAIVAPLPERRMVTISVVTPWPSGESLSETLHHEIGHAWIRPITAQIPDTAASVMLEEQLIETLGVYLASLSEDARATARRALAPIVDMYAPRLRARISASAGQRARGGSMDPKLVMEALEALIAGDTAKCSEILKGLVAAAASGGAAPATEAAAETAQTAQTAQTATAGATEVQSAEPPMPRPAARKENHVTDIAAARARKEAEDLAADMRRMHASALPNAKANLILGARARLGAEAISPATEKRILAAPTFERAEEIVAIIEESPIAQRARSGVGHQSAALDVDAAKAVPAAELAKEGFNQAWIASYTKLATRDPEAAAAELEGGREGLAANRARLAKTGGAS